MLDISNERVVDSIGELDESNHMAKLYKTLRWVKPEPNTELVKYLPNSIGRYVIFEINSKTWWVKEPEYKIIKFMLNNFINSFQLWYQASDISGYELHIKFD